MQKDNKKTVRIGSDRDNIVYMHTNTVNGKKYIGITKQNPNERWRKGKGYRGNVAFYNAIKKYGWDSFKHEILFCNLTRKEAEILEICLIKYHKSDNKKFGYNISHGGDKTTLGFKHSLESRLKMSKNSKGQVAWNKGLIGDKNPFYGKKRPKSVTDKMKANNKFKKPVICLDTLEEFESIMDASRCLNICRTYIRDICHHKFKSVHGLHFMFLSEYKQENEYV